MTDEILRLPAVKARIGLSRSSIYLQVSEGTFPSPVHLGPRAIGWLASEIDAWVESCTTASRAEPGKNEARNSILGRTTSRRLVRSRGKRP